MMGDAVGVEKGGGTGHGVVGGASIKKGNSVHMRESVLKTTFNNP
jgi:hypothetical protein